MVRRQIEFNHFASKEIEEALKSGEALQNVYALEVQPEEALEEAIDHAINRQTSEDDTHPSPNDRFRFTRKIVSQSEPPISGMVWDLFADRAALTGEMTLLIQQKLQG